MVGAPELGQPDFDILLDWVEGRLDADKTSEVAVLVASGDARLTTTVEWLRNFHEVAGTIASQDPPPIIRQALRQHFARWKQSRESRDGRSTTVTARLVFDSRHDLAPAGIRGGAGDIVHMAYSSDAGELLLDLSRPTRGTLTIDGQVVLAADRGGASAFVASIAGSGFARHSLDVDAFGRFILRDVPEMQCELRAGNGDVTIVAQLDLRFEPPPL